MANSQVEKDVVDEAAMADSSSWLVFLLAICMPAFRLFRSKRLRNKTLSFLFNTKSLLRPSNIRPTENDVLSV